MSAEGPTGDVPSSIGQSPEHTGPMDLSLPVWEGERTVLRRLEPDDCEAFLALESLSFYQRAWERVTAPRSAEHCREWLRAEAARDPLDDNFMLAITDRKSRDLVGCVNTNQADPASGRFYLGLMVAPEHHRHGYALDAAKLVVGYMFGERRYQKVQAYVHDFNTASQTGLLAGGWTLEGRLRRHDFFGGQYHDNLIFGMTAEEYFDRYGTGRVARPAESSAPPLTTVPAPRGEDLPPVTRAS